MSFGRRLRKQISFIGVECYGVRLKKVVAVASKYKVALGGMLAIVATCTGVKGTVPMSFR